MVGRARAAGLVVCLLALGCGESSSSSDSKSGGTGGTGGTAGTGAGGSNSGGSSGSGGSGGGVTQNPADYLDRPLRDQVTALESAKIKSSGLTQAYLDRIATRDTGPNGIHAVLALDPKAKENATLVDQQSGKGAKLQGAAILVKDNIDTQSVATTAGSLALVENLPASDAHVVANFRAENAVMLGKTNLSEWANFRGDQATSGWSSAGGQTYNGVDPKLSPCGSSSGSAAAVAAGLCSAALGTETDGSLVCPASVNGVVAFKPTIGLVSRAGVIPISHTQDTVGPITRTVGDAARMLSVLAGPDPLDPATQAIPSGFSLDFEAPLATASLAGKRLGVVALGVQPAVQAVFDAERARLEAAGAVLVDVALNQAGYGDDELTVLLYEFKVDINAYLTSHERPGQAATLAELIAFNQANAEKVMPYFGQEVFTQAEATDGLDSPVYLTAKQTAADAAGKNGIAALLAQNQLDALISPTNDVAWTIDYATGDPWQNFKLMSRPAAVAGYPHLTVPMGRVNGLPVGISFFAAAWDDAKVLALGYAYEQLPH